jgi:hypothetical protein
VSPPSSAKPGRTLTVGPWPRSSSTWRERRLDSRQVLGAKLTEANAAGRLPPATDASPIAGSLNHDLIVDRRRAITAGERVLPRGEMDSTMALVALETSRQSLRELLATLDGLDLSAFTMPHPALGPIDGYQWFLFLGSHEARHAGQIREIGTSLRA